MLLKSVIPAHHGISEHSAASGINLGRVCDATLGRKQDVQRFWI
jgi:hypothetical protein